MCWSSTAQSARGAALTQLIQPGPDFRHLFEVFGPQPSAWRSVTATTLRSEPGRDRAFVAVRRGQVRYLAEHGQPFLPSAPGRRGGQTRIGRCLEQAVVVTDDGVQVLGLYPHGMRHGHKTWMAEDGIPEILAEHRPGHEVPGMKRGIWLSRPGDLAIAASISGERHRAAASRGAPLSPR